MDRPRVGDNARKVGYHAALSPLTVFLKLRGVTPRDYRQASNDTAD